MYSKGIFTETEWDFGTAVFFTATMLTSIGYGFIVPLTTEGRMFRFVHRFLQLEKYGRFPDNWFFIEA